MPPKRGQRSDGYEFTRAAYDEMRDSEITHGVKYKTVLQSTMQKGVWEMVTTATADYGPFEGRVVAKQLDRLPNVEGVSFEALLYQHYHKLARMVESWWIDWQRTEAQRVV